MTDYTKDIKYTQTANLINNRRFADALTNLFQMNLYGDKAATAARLKQIEETYAYLRQYALDGISDPSRQQQLDDIARRLHLINDQLERRKHRRETNTEYYSVLRYEAAQNSESTTELLFRYMDLTSDNSDEGFRLLDRIFKRVWVSFPLSKEAVETLEGFFRSPSVSAFARQTICGALMLGGLEFYDEARLILLLEAYITSKQSGTKSSEEEILQTAAIAGALLLMLTYGERSNRISSGVADKISECASLPGWTDDIEQTYMCIIRTLDTPRINRKILDEMVPDLLKMKPEIEKNMPRLSDIEDFEELEENPQWQDILEKSGLAESMREMAEIQQEGGDVFMSTFSHLKGFPFFRSVANWFMPFSPEHPELKSVREDESAAKIIKSLTKAAPFLCNSDKYSLALSISQMPAEQRKMMSGQINMASEAQLEDQNTELLPEKFKRANQIRSAVQDLYRFFNLYNRKTDFNNPFEMDMEVANLPLLGRWFAPDSKTITAAAEFCFAHKYYRRALALFNFIADGGVFTSELYQKIGYCFQKDGLIEEALEAYRKAELIDSENQWTLKRIAVCLSLLGRNAEALSYFERLFAIDPENPSAIRSLIQAQIAAGKTENSAELIARLDYFAPHPRNKKLEAQLEIINKDFDLAFADLSEYLNRIGGSAGADDYFTHATLAIWNEAYNEALDSLTVAQELPRFANLSTEDFATRFLSFFITFSSRKSTHFSPQLEMARLVADSLFRGN